MKVSIDAVDDLLVPDELEEAYRAYLEEEGIAEDDAEFGDFFMDTDQLNYYDGKIVSNEMYDFLIAYELGITPATGGYPQSWKMAAGSLQGDQDVGYEPGRYPGYEVTCFGWIDNSDKYPDMNMLATEVEYFVEDGIIIVLREGKIK